MTLTTNAPSLNQSTASLEDSYARIKRHINAKTGLIPWIRPLPTPYAQDQFHIHVAKHPVMGSVKSLADLRAILKHSSSAIGRTAREARMLAACEALERWSCVAQGNEYTEIHAFKEIEQKAIAPDVLHGYSQLQYERRDVINKNRKNNGAFIPEPFDPAQPVAWCPVYNLSTGEWRYTLKSSCFFGFSDTPHVYSAGDSRGVAAGPNLEFCTWRALLELIETDTGAIWNANQLLCPEVDIASFEDAYFNTLIDVHDAINRDLWVLDISLDIKGIRVFAAFSADRDSKNVVKGFGTHPLAHKALEKALMECCQMLPNVMKQEADENLAGASSTDMPAHVSTPFHFKPDPHKSAQTKSDYEDAHKISTIGALVADLNNKNIDVFAQDVSREEIGLKVVRVIGVGMRSWFDRRGPGRLYDVPVSLGLRSHPLKEEEVFDVTIE